MVWLSITSAALRAAHGSEGFAWVTSHVFRETAATEPDAAGLSARQIADQLGRSTVPMTQDQHSRDLRSSTLLDGQSSQVAGGRRYR